jgi:hypothetical protein
MCAGAKSLSRYGPDGLHHGADLYKIKRVRMRLAKCACGDCQNSDLGICEIRIKSRAALHGRTNGEIFAHNAIAFFDHIARQ